MDLKKTDWHPADIIASLRKEELHLQQFRDKLD